MSVPTNLIPTLISGLPEYAGSSTLGYLPYVLEGRTYKVQFSNIAAVGAVPSSRVIAAGTGLAGGGDLSENRVISIAAGGVGFDQLALSGVVAGTYGSGSAIPILTVDSKGRVTSATTVALDVTGFVPTSRTITAGDGLTGGGSLANNITLAANFSATTPSALGTASAGTSIAVSRGDHVHPAVNLSDTTQTQGALPLGRGGTGDALSPVAGAVVYSTGTKFALTNPGLVGQVLVSNGTDEPQWQTIAGAGTVTSVNASGGATGLSFTGGPITVSGTLTLGGTLAVASGGTGATDAATALTNLGAYPASNPAGYTSNVGTVTSVSGTGTVSGLSLSGTVTSAGSLTLGGALVVTPSDFASQSANTVLAAPNGSAGVPTFRAIVAADIPTLNQNTTGTASNVTGIVAVANGGTGASVAGTARTNLGAAASGANTDITSIALTTGTISATPSGGTDIVNKAYADSIASGINFHQSVRLATAAALPANTYNNGASGVGATLTANANGALSVDGVAVAVGNRILVKNEATQANNGVYTVTDAGSSGGPGPGPGGSNPYILTRATDFDSAGTGVDQIDAGDFFLVTAGSTQANTSWVQQTPLPITVGTTAIVFTQFAAPVLYSAGTGLTLAGTVFSITNTGVSASTYGSASSVPVLAINAQGQVTSASSSSIAIAASQITSGTVTVAQGGTGATTLTGYVKGNGTSAFTASATIPASDISSGAALTEVDDTNVTLTLGGSPTTALLAATSITVGWTGQLAVGRGGTGASTLAANGVLLGNGTSAISATAVGTTGQVLVGNTGAAPTWATLSSSAVTSFSAGTTGFTPSSATTGAITLAGTLNVANGGTGAATAFTAGSVVFAGASGVYTQDNANLFWDDTNNRLGIGNTSPGYRLDVSSADTLAGFGYAARLRSNATAAAATLQFTNSAASAENGLIACTDAGLITVQGSSAMALRTNGSERMRIDSSGNVGIGTTTPGARLTVNGGSGTSQTRFEVSTTEVQEVATNAAQNAYANRLADAAQHIWKITGSERMRIDTSGNVGIGAAPLSFTPLYIYRSGSDAGLRAERASGAAVDMYATASSAYFGTANSYPLILQTNGSEKMRIDSSGNVGIGTSSPASKLDVNGILRLSGGEDSQLQWTNNGQTWRLNNSTAGRLYFYDVTGAKFPFGIAAGTASDTLCLTSTGVGIGTNSPATALDVATGFIQLSSGATARTKIFADASISYFTAEGARALTLSTNGAERMRIDSSGNVMLGNSAGAPKFSVTFSTAYAWGGGWNGGAVLIGGNGQASGAGSGGLGITYDDTVGSTLGPLVPGVAWKPFRIFSDNIQFNTNGGTERMRIGSNGSVAIGGTGTDASLHIQQAYGGYDRLTQMSPNTANKNAFNIMAAKNSGGSDLWWSWGVRNDNVWVLQEGVNYSLNGGLGFYYDSGGQAYKSGGGTWAASSDVRIKTNITPISDAASRIMALKPSNFDYRVPEAHANRVSDRGFIAQDFEEVYPHSVSESAMVADAEKAFVTGDDKIKAISLNTDFFADIVALVQEQQTTINDLRARVAQLEGN